MNTTTIPPLLAETIREDPERKRRIIPLTADELAAARAVGVAATECARIRDIPYAYALSAVRAGIDPEDEEAIQAHLAAEWEREAAQARAACRAELVIATGDRIPPRFGGATATAAPVARWVDAIIAEARGKSQVPGVDHVNGGPSLLITGPIGTGKTYQAYGALRALAAASVRAQWVFITAVDLYGTLRPRAAADSETEFRRIESARLLIIDDLGSAKESEWTEEVNYRIVNYRYEREMATIFTTNVLPRDLPARLGQRVASRLCEMAVTVPLVGRDRRVTRREAA